jgi:hypothetical protein
MLTKIWNWIVGEEQKVEHILSDFIDTVKRLERHAVEKTHEEIAHAEALVELAARRAAASAEAAKASDIAGKIKELIGHV